MEALKMPLREIEEKFTLSEITLQAWQSQEQGYQMRQRMKRTTDKPKVRIPEVEVHKKVENIDSALNTLPKPAVDSRGRFTLKNQTGEDALKVFHAMGLNFPMMG